MTIPTIVTRAGKGSALTWTEGDTNLTNLRDATISVTDGTNTSVLNLNDTLTIAAGTNISVAVNPATDTLTITNTATAFNPASPGAIGGTTPAAGTFTTLNASSTVGGNGFSTYLASPPSIGGGTPNIGRFTTITSTIASGTAPFTVASTTQVTNLNASYLAGNNWATPAALGTTTQNSGAFTQVTTKGGSGVYKLVLDGTANSNPAWTTNGAGLRILNATYTDSSSLAGTLAASHVHAIAAPTLASANIITVTDSASLYISGAPIAGTNTSITNGWALLTGGNIKAAGFTGSGAGLTSIPNSALTNNAITFGATSTSLGGTVSALNSVSIGATTPSTGAFTTLTTSGAYTGTVTTTGNGINITYNPTTGTGAAIQATGKDSQGGVGYFDFLKATNTTTGVTNGNKSIRLSSTGDLQIINSAYTTTILSLTDAGAFTVPSMTVSTNTTLKDIRETISTVTYAATITPDVANGTIQKITLTGNVTFSAFANPVAGQSMTLIITQDATGSRTLTSTMKFSGGSKTLSTAANAVDILSVFYDGTNYYASLGKAFA